MLSIKDKVYLRLSGGLGNQLFMYAASRRLSMVNNADLVIDISSGFASDPYMRKFELDSYPISFIKPSFFVRFFIFSKPSRFFFRLAHYFFPSLNISYIESSLEYDSSLLNLTVSNFLYLEGYFQSYLYFNDISNEIRSTIKPSHIPLDYVSYLSTFTNKVSIAVHFRFFDPSLDSFNNLSIDYYSNAIALLSHRFGKNIHFHIFSDTPDNVPLSLFDSFSYSFVSDCISAPSDTLDLWLMSQCSHFIIANSTFSWWGAWLSISPNKIVIAPHLEKLDGVSAWGFSGLIPDDWITL